MRSSLESVRRIALELRPEALDDLGLVSALAVLGERFAERSGLATAGSAGLTLLPGSVSAVSHLWWVLPALLRSGDLALTGGSTWAELLAEALEEVSGEPPDVPWHQLHAAVLTHRTRSPVRTVAAR